jgi:cbb3-type cytochrome oxidase subunit 3
VFPPSVHPNGKRYELVRRLRPVQPPDWLVKELVSVPASLGVVAVAGTSTRYGKAALERAASTVSGAREGSRNDTLNREALGIGQLVAGGGLNEGEALASLLSAAMQAGLTESESRRTIASAFTAGFCEPRSAPESLRATDGVQQIVAHGPESEMETSVVKFPDAPAPEAFYGLAGEFVRLVGPHTEADETALLAHFLIYFGNAVGRDAFFRVGAARHTAAENVAFVGATGDARKGTAENEARRPFLLANDAWTARITTGLSSGEGLIWAVRDPIEKREAIREKGRVIGYEKVVVDEGVQDKRICVQESELGKTCRVMDREGNTLSATIRELWDAREVLRIMTKNTPAEATGAHGSIIGHITKEELLRRLDRTESANGFGNRFLWVAVRRSKFLPDGGTLRDADLADFVLKLREALGQGREVREMTRDGEARAMWHSVYRELETGRTGLFGAVTARAAPHVLRLSMIYALTDGSAIIRAPHLAAALAFWTYCEDSARYVFGDATGDPEADAIHNALRDAPDRRLRREAIRDLFSRHVPAQRIESALALLAKLGKAYMETEKTKGRPAEWWAYGTARRAESAKSAESNGEAPEGTDFPRLDRISRTETRV